MSWHRFSHRTRGRWQRRWHLQEDGAGLAVAADGGPMEGGAALPVARRDLRVKHDEQAHAVRKALVGRPVQRCPPVYVRAAQHSGIGSVCLVACLECFASALLIEIHTLSYRLQCQLCGQAQKQTQCAVFQLARAEIRDISKESASACDDMPVRPSSLEKQHRVQDGPPVNVCPPSESAHVDEGSLPVLSSHMAGGITPPVLYSQVRTMAKQGLPSQQRAPHCSPVQGCLPRLVRSAQKACHIAENPHETGVLTCPVPATLGKSINGRFMDMLSRQSSTCDAIPVDVN